jgi:2,4-dienoyl-CoA reductase-like NADH-dependent reductase (Old Yellow Enzyme family)
MTGVTVDRLDSQGRGLFDGVTIGRMRLPNRIVMAPMTRGRASKSGVPTAEMARYYAQRSSAGLIISEAIGISRAGLGWIYAPGIWNEAQVAAWRTVTERVHNEGGRIFAQLWHMGRVAHRRVTGLTPVSASPSIAPGNARTYEGSVGHEYARTLAWVEIAEIVDDYRAAARNAIAAGFDGVQIHAANGYLIDQFLRSSTNWRADHYGGSPANRTRFLLEVVDAVIAEVGSDRTAVRLSPNGASQGVDDRHPFELFPLAAALLAEREIAFLELREQRPDGTFGRTPVARLSPAIRHVFDGVLVLNHEYTAQEAQRDLDSGLADAISFGRPFIANPDLPHRLANRIELETAPASSYYRRGSAGYTDYPAAEPNLEGTRAG